MVRKTIEQFSELQTLDTRILAIENQLALIPEMLKESRELFEKTEKEKTDAENAFRIEKEAMLAAETTLVEKNTLLASAQKKLTSVQNNKEYEAALKELDNLRKNIAESEDTVKTKKAAMETLESRIIAKTGESADKSAAYEAEKVEKEEENRSLFDELAVLKKKREDFAAAMKKSLLSRYERVRAARQNLAIVSVCQEVCSGCNMKIPPQLAVDVQKEKELLQCPYCQRFLYSEKEIPAEKAS